MFVILIPVLTCLDLILKYAVSSFDNKDLPYDEIALLSEHL